MKRLLTLVLAFSCSLSAMNIYAQDGDSSQKKDNLIFNHLSAGVSVGLDGVGAHLAAPIGRHFGVRAGYTFIPNYNTTIPDIPIVGSKIDANDLKFTINEGEPSQRDIDLSKVDFGLTINNFGPHLLVDLYPGKKSGFHFTLGAVMAQDKHFLSTTADLSGQLQPNEYASLGISYKGIPDITTDENGILHLDLRSNSIHPYAGIGFGRPLNMRHRVSVNFDLGIVYLGKAEVYSYDYAAAGGKADVQITSAGLENEDDGVIDDIIGKYPFFPVMKLSINVRLF